MIKQWIMRDNSVVCWDSATSIVTISDRSFKMPRSLDNMQEYVDLPSNYKYSFKIQPSGYLKISAMVPEWGFTWSILCRPVLV
jgi:hypothetical protein